MATLARRFGWRSGQRQVYLSAEVRQKFGRVLDAPIHEMIGGSVRNHLETYTTGFRGTGTTLQERARACIEAGYR